MKIQFVPGIIVLFILINPVFSQIEIVKTTSCPENITKLAPRLIFDIPDGHDKPDSVHSFYFPTNYDSSSVITHVYSYDASGNLILATTLSIHREEYVYNSKNLLIEHKIYDNDADIPYPDSLYPVTKFVYSYDEKNRLTGKSLFGGNFETKGWLPDTSSKEEYIYNSEGQLIRTCIYGYGLENQRKLSTVIDYSYDKASKVLTAVESLYLNFIDQWELEDSSIYYFNSDSLCLLNEVYIYNSVDSVWERFFKLEYSYNEHGRILYQIEGSYWPDYFLPGWKDIYTYNESNQLIYYSHLNWNRGKQIWDKLNSYLYFYSGH
jgi:YD repeat-containing protein